MCTYLNAQVQTFAYAFAHARAHARTHTISLSRTHAHTHSPTHSLNLVRMHACRWDTHKKSLMQGANTTTASVQDLILRHRDAEGAFCQLCCILAFVARARRDTHADAHTQTNTHRHTHAECWIKDKAEYYVVATACCIVLLCVAVCFAVCCSVCCALWSGNTKEAP